MLLNLGIDACARNRQAALCVSPRVINGVHVVPMGKANAFLIEGDDGLTLIDAGFPAKEAAVFGTIDGIGRSADQLRNLISTLGHPDHIGNAAAIVRKTGARTYRGANRHVSFSVQIGGFRSCFDPGSQF